MENDRGELVDLYVTLVLSTHSRPLMKLEYPRRLQSDDFGKQLRSKKM